MKSVYKSARTTIAIILVIATVAVFGYDLFDIQVNKNEYYAAQNNTVKTYTVPIEAARGEIVDRNGNPLVTNRQGNSIILDAAYFPSSKNNDERNRIVLNLISLFNSNGEEFVHNLPLKADKKGNISFFTENDDDKYKQDIATMKSADMLNLQSYATAQNCFDAMVEKYGLENYLSKYGVQKTLEIGNVRYELTRLLFSVSNPVKIADDVSDKTVATIKENPDLYTGADVQVVAYREYTDSTLAPHIIGTVRKINNEEYERLKDQGYGITDEIGESGIESACESDLRGTPGEKTVTINADGTVTEEITKQPVQGDTIVLTIEKDLQKLAQQKLEKICKKVAYNSTGAVVVTGINSGEVLAAASYPSYDLNDYYTKYKQLASNKYTPLYNRFALGTYAPGSTFKPAMAAAALQEGVITENSTFFCGHEFRVNDMVFKCTGSHGSLSVKYALQHSCNIFFYNCAQKLGIETLLFEILYPLGFNAAQIRDIYRALEGQPGKTFSSEHWRVVKDRKYLLIEAYQQVEQPLLAMEKYSLTPDFIIPRDKEVACFDADKLLHPLSLRLWQQGDVFTPFGMKGRKKVSDYMTDRKFSLLRKEQQWVLCCGKDIIWLVGERTDNRFRVDSSTQRVLIIHIIKKKR